MRAPADDPRHGRRHEVVGESYDGAGALDAVTRRLLDTAVGRRAEQAHMLGLIDTLTGQERDVLACLGHRLSNAEIARS